MLMIIKESGERSLTFRLAGKLVGQWTLELERCWQGVAERHSYSKILLDLTEVTFVDEAGKRLLAAMSRAGVEMVTADVLMNALVEQIALRASSDEEANLGIIQ